MQLGFLRSERPLEVRSYLPNFRLGKWVSRSAERASGLCPDDPKRTLAFAFNFFEKSWIKNFIRASLCVTSPLS